MKKIKLNRDKFALVDDQDFEYLNQFSWRLNTSKDQFCIYAMRRIQKNNKVTRILMHREIINAPFGTSVDHIDGNTLNNQRCNLRIATMSQNLANQRKTRGTSKYMGVSYHKGAAKFEAYVTCKGIRYYLGLFENEIQAAQARNIKAVQLFGSFAKLNKI